MRTINKAVYIFIFSLFCKYGLFAQATTSTNTKKEETTERSTKMEAAITGSNIIKITNSGYRLQVRTWNEQKVQVQATVKGANIAGLSEKELQEKIGLAIKTFGNRTEIKSGTTQLYTGTWVYSQGISPVLINSDSKLLGASGGGNINTVKPANASLVLQAELVIMIPAANKVEIESRYSDVVAENDFKNLDLELVNGSFSGKNIQQLSVKSRFSNIYVNDVNEAEIEFTNGNFTANHINTLDIDSKSSTIEFETAKTMTIRSERDNYNIETIDRVDGRKMFGEMRINTLNNSFDLEGKNADIRIKNINSSVEKININNSYADIRLPVKKLQNYFVTFNGYSTVFSPFEKEMVKVEEKKTTAKSEEASPKLYTASDLILTGGATYYGSATEKKNFTAAVGDTKGKHTAFKIECHQCTVDFK